METTNNIQLIVDYCNHKRWSQRTIRSYGYALKRFLLSFPKIYQHDHISAADVSDYLLKIPGRSSRCTAHAAINLWFLVKGQPEKLKFIPYPEKEEKIPIHVNSEEFIRMLAVCQNKKHRAILCIMYDCGLRISEIINLKIADIDSSNMQVHVRQAKGRKDRELKLTEALLFILREYVREFRPKEYLFNGQGELLQYSDRSIQKIVEHTCQKAGITKPFTPHKFRHGFAMAHYENGKSLADIALTLGHKSTKTTQIYARKSNKVIQNMTSPLELILAQHPKMKQLANSVLLNPKNS